MSSCEVSLSSSDHLAGDVVRATVTFRGHGDTLEWAAVQLHGHCWFDPRLVSSVVSQPQPVQGTPKGLRSRRSSSSLSASEKKTAMPDMSTWVEGTTSLFSTRPHCLAAELVLSGDHSFDIQAVLPPVLPPTFRGVSTRYAYLLTVCVKLRSEESARVAHVPIQVAGTAGSLGDAARQGPPSSAFKDYLNGRPHSNGSKRRFVDASDEEEELVMLQATLHENGFQADFEYTNRFPLRYDAWDPTITSNLKTTNEKFWFLERDEGDEETFEQGPLPSPRLSDSHHDTFFTDGAAVRALNAQTGKGRLAKCYVHPAIIHPGDALNVRLDFNQAAERCLKIQAIIEVEERTAGPPPLVAVLEPLLRRRQGSGPWLKALGSKTVDVSECSSCAFSLSTYGSPPDFSTDLIVVHTYVRIEFTTESMVCNLRIPLHVRPPPRTTRVVSVTDGDLSRMSSPRSPIPSLAGRFEEQSPPQTPKKKLVF